jgi:spermidine synthase
VIRSPKSGNFLIHICLFLSGAAGLVYEVLWTRILSFSFGHTTYAVTTVLAVFMGGLALGSRYLGRIADRVASPLRFYAWLELGIGIYCLAAPTLLSFARHIYVTNIGSMTDNPLLRTVLQFGLAALVLVVPTTLMGGTLPAACKGIVRRLDEGGPLVARFYGINTMGAAAGAFAVGYWLLPTIGVAATNYLGVGMNLLAGTAVFLLFRKDSPPLPAAERPRGENPSGRTPLEKLLLLSFAVSGAIGMSYQIVWTRALVLVIGSSTYAFSAILVTFLLGIAMGSLIYARISIRDGARFFAKLQLGIAASAFVLVPLFNFLPGIFLALFKGYEGSFLEIQFFQFLIVVIVVLLPTTLLGMTFPCIAGLLAKDISRFGSDVGTFYAYNTFGAITGALLTGFLGIPGIGAYRTLTLGIGLGTLVGAAILSYTNPFRRRVLSLVVGAVVLLLAIPPLWDRRMMTTGVFALRGIPPSIGALVDFRIKDLLFFREGISSTIAVVRDERGDTALLVNGKTDAATNLGDMETQINLANIPMLLHPAPRRVGVIGLGSGKTAAIAALYPETDHVDVIEIEPAVRDAVNFFKKENLNILENPRVKIRIDDGRSYFEGTRSSYDVVISAPSNPWMSGIANLFTREFFQTIRKKLSPGGIFCQWVQGYSLTPEEFKLIARTFQEVFPAASLWAAFEGDFILIGHKDRLWIADPDAIRRREIDSPGLKYAFRIYGGDPVRGIAAIFLLEPKELRAFTGIGKMNTDDLPLIEYSAPRSLYLLRLDTYHDIKEEILRFKGGRPFPFFTTDPGIGTPRGRFLMGRYLLSRARPQEATREFLAALTLGYQSAFRWQRIRTGPLDVHPLTDMRETFDGPRPLLPLFPRLGSHKPGDAEKEDLAVWAANMDYFADMSGIVSGSGVDGSAGFLIAKVAGPGSSAYFAPLAVKPSAEYVVEFAMKSETIPQGEAGVGVVEYDAFKPTGMQPSLADNERHLVGMQDKVRITGPRNWERHSFAFRTSPKTRMIHLILYRGGIYDRNPVVFDDIRIREVP